MHPTTETAFTHVGGQPRRVHQAAIRIGGRMYVCTATHYSTQGEAFRAAQESIANEATLTGSTPRKEV